MTMSVKEKPEEIEWSTEEEVQLFFALEGLKPVGVNKHFYMACIVERLSKSLNRLISGESIWEHLRTMYNLDVLDEMEPIPFPTEEKEFSLPDSEFSSLMSRKCAESEDRKFENKDKITLASKQTPSNKDLEKKVSAKLLASDTPKRSAKRTRGSMSLESNSPSTTPPPTSSSKRRRV